MNAFYDALDILSGMIRIPSFSRDENEVADFLSETWEKAGYKVNRKGNNLWMVAPGFALDKAYRFVKFAYRYCEAGCGLEPRPF
jgi:acetylornithine deacetylase